MNHYILLADILISICIGIYAYKAKHRFFWLAAIPIVNLWLLTNLADAPFWMFLLLLIPFVNILIYVLLWMRIVEGTSKQQWLGLLMLIPFLNIAAAVYISYYEPCEIH